MHVYCTYQNDLEILRVILEQCNPNHQNYDKNTPFHLLLLQQNTMSHYHKKELCMEFLRNKCNLTVCNNNDETILDLIPKLSYGKEDLAKEILLSNSSSPIKLKELISSAGEDFILLWFLLDTDIIKLLANLSIDPTPLYTAQKAFFKDRREPLEVPISMLFIGDTMTGKTTLINSLRQEAGLEISEGEPERTAGIIPSSFRSSKYGKVTAYDFAGQREYYPGHEAVMQSILQKTPPIVLIHVKFTTEKKTTLDEKIMEGIEYWTRIMKNHLKSKKSHLIVVCSHADEANENELKLTPQAIKDIISINDNFETSEVICMDCRKPVSTEMYQLVRTLEQKTGFLRHKAITSFKAHTLYVFLTQHLKDRPFLSMTELFHLQQTVCKDLSLKGLLSLDFRELRELCEELASDGQILLLKDTISRMNLILLDTQSLLNEISGKLFAPRNFPIHEGIAILQHRCDPLLQNEITVSPL